MSSQKWDYAYMEESCGSLNKLQARALANRELMSSEFSKVIVAMDGSEAANALLLAYESQTSTMDLFPQIIESLSTTLQTCIDTMQEVDKQIMNQITSMFEL